MKPRQLKATPREGQAPDADGLVGWELRGYNVVKPIGEPVVRLRGIRRFAMGLVLVVGVPVVPGHKAPSEGGQPHKGRHGGVRRARQGMLASLP
jgi:hypothetical protein